MKFNLSNDREISYENNSQESIAIQTSGIFKDEVDQVNEKIKIMASRIKTLEKDLESRLSSLGGLIEVNKFIYYYHSLPSF